MSHKVPFKREMIFEYGEPRELAPSIRRIVANNPGPFTYSGTNTYLIGRDEIAVIDPGPDDSDHLDAILNAASGGTISKIIATHTHMDHTAGMDRLKEATGADTYGAVAGASARGGTATSPSDGDFIDRNFKPDIALGEGDLIETDEWSLKTLHTPGHAPDHICLDVQEQNILITGDHVMAWNTSVIAPPEGNMNAYMASLEKLLDHEHEMYLPGHGGTIPAPRRIVRSYLVHRKWREAAIMDAIRNGHSTIINIREKVYNGIDAAYANAATLSVFAHIERLYASGHISCEQPFSSDASFYPTETEERES